MKSYYSSFIKEIFFFINNPKITFLLFFWMLIFFSINARPDEIAYFGYDLGRSINSIRMLTPILLTYLTTIYLIFFFIKNHKYNYFKKINNLVFLFYAYYSLQALGLAVSDTRDFNLDNFFLVILCLGVLNIFIFIKLYEFEKYCHLFLKVSVFILIIVIVTIFILKKNDLSFAMIYHNLYTLTKPHEAFLYGELPRSTGISRTLSIINLFFMVYLFQIKNIRFKIITYIPIMIVTFIIWSLQSRGTIICYYTTVFIFLLLTIKTIQKKITNVFLMLVVPVLVFHFLSSTFHPRDINLDSMDINLDSNIDTRIQYYIEKKIIIKDDVKNLNMYQKKEMLIDLAEDLPASRFAARGLNSSGRVEMWKYILVNYDKKKIFGYGPQGDRILLLTFMDKYSTNISNAAFHAFINGGYGAIIVFLIIYLKLINRVYKLLINNKITPIKQNNPFIISLIFIIFFSIRALVENSFTVFSIDFLVFIISLFIIDEIYKKKFK